MSNERPSSTSTLNEKRNLIAANDFVVNQTIATNTGTSASANTALNTLVGAVTETAPASDTASSGLNGRLQRIAQRLTSLISSVSTAANQVLMIADTTAIKDNTNDALGGEGTEYIFGTGVVTGKTYRYLVVNADATFTTLAGSVTPDLLTTLGIGANTVTKGMVIRGINGELIEDVTLATGSVTGIL